MAVAIPMKIRQQVLADCDAGMGTTAAARKHHVSPAWVRRLKQYRRERGEIAPRKGGGARASLTKIDRGQLAQLVHQRPDATLVELGQALGIVCAKSAIWKALRTLKLSYKKSRFAPPSRTGPMWPSVGRLGV
jgi:transposase